MEDGSGSGRLVGLRAALAPAEVLSSTSTVWRGCLSVRRYAKLRLSGTGPCFSVLNKTFDLESGKFCLPRVTGLTNTHTEATFILAIKCLVQSSAAHALF